MRLKREKIANQKATAKALGLPDVAMEPSVQAALLKEKAKDQRNAQLLEALGMGGGAGGASPFLDTETSPSEGMPGLGQSGGS